MQSGSIWTDPVADVKEKDEHINERLDSREVYARPKLNIFGPVGALTQAGSMMNTEMVVMGMAVGMGML